MAKSKTVKEAWKPIPVAKKTSIGSSPLTKLNPSKRGKARKKYRGQGR